MEASLFYFEFVCKNMLELILKCQPFGPVKWIHLIIPLLVDGSVKCQQLITWNGILNFQIEWRPLQYDILRQEDFCLNIFKTRMHSSRMCTARSSSRHGGLHTPHPPPEQTPPSPSPKEQVPPGPGTPSPKADTPRAGNSLARSPSTSPLGVTLDQVPLNFTLGCGSGAPQPDPPKLRPWVWAWKPARHAGIPPPSWRPAARHVGIPPAMHAGIAPPPPCGQTHTCKKHNLRKLRLRAVMKTTSWGISANYRTPCRAFETTDLLQQNKVQNWNVITLEHCRRLISRSEKLKKRSTS